MRFYVVRLTQLLVILFIVSLATVSAFAQSGQTGPAPQSVAPAALQQTPETTQTPPSSSSAAPQEAPEKDPPFRRVIIVPARLQQKTPQVPDDLLLFKGASKLPPDVFQNGLQEAAREHLKQLLAEQHEHEAQRNNVDPGIYARQIDGANVCGAIVSYNFSAGANPQLESVTTCTPSNAVTTQRARVRNPRPAGPQILKTTFQQQEKK
jgi:hypothetical protein